MALVVFDRVQEVTATTGTGTITLGGPVTGFQSFAVVGNGNTTYYTIVNGDAWEIGIGTYSSTGPTLARTTILSNSNGNTSRINLVGASNVFVTYPAEKSINYDANDVATIGSTLGYSDTGIIGSFASTVAGYNQVIVQNKSTATNASSNFNVSNDAATSSTGYAELGINSSTYTGTGSFNIAGASYLASASTHLTIGTYGAYNVHFVTNSNTTDAMTIFNSGGVSLGGYADPGIGTLYANNVYLGYNTITAAAGTTILTNASAAWQQVVGTTTQTIQLPDATTLYKGLAFTVTSSSTDTVTVKDNASATIDTVVTGGSAILVLTNNSTSAGTWVAYSYIPSSYDFSATTANFGNATITNAIWNGSTIGTAYGGTGLTTFGSANYALYSTSSSALAAGTLPIAAGGTGQTTANTAFNALVPSQTSNSGKYLTTDGSNTSWGTGAITPAAVSDQANTSTGYFGLPSGTTAQRPGSPANGYTRFNTTLNAVETYSGISSKWEIISYFTVSDAPTIGTATAISSTSATITYTAPTNNGSSTITSYTAVASPGGQTGTVSQSTSGTITVSGLTTGTAYTFTVYATNAAGNSASSAASNSITTWSVPGAPTGVSAAQNGNVGQLAVSYTAPVNNGGTAITSYTAVSSPGGFTGTLSTAGSGTITVTGLANNTSYTFVVYATNSVGNSANSSPSSSVSTPTVPGAPTIGTATATSSTQATVTYTAPASNGGNAITSYTAVSSPGGLTGTLATAGSGTITVNGLTTGTAYTFTVYATNGVGNSASSSASNSITTWSVPGAPTIGTATATGPTTATVTYTAPASNGGTAITSYTATSSPGGLTGTLSTAGSGTITVSGLSPSTSYTFTVKATNAVGQSAASGASNSITTFSLTITYLVIAGGGGGGTNAGGGGGAGGLLTSTATLTSGAVYTATIGAGGASSTAGANKGSNGNNSSLVGTSVSVTAIGGGGAGSGSNVNGVSGGSGGGGSINNGTGSGGAGTSGQGFAGGSCSGSPNGGAGGGGAGAAGAPCTGSTTGSLGGIGVQSSITGTAIYYAGGGNGQYNASAAPSGGTAAGASGAANTGAGAGGNGAATGGLSGGSGVVIISIASSGYTGTVTGSPTVTTSGSNTIIKFTATGTYTA